MPKRELERRMADKAEMKKLLADVHEWYAKQTEPNRYCSVHDGLEVLPY
jgi:hypothetical protein